MLTGIGALEFLTLALVLTTLVYAWLTYRISRSSEASVQLASRQTDLLTRPYVDISVFVPPKIPVLYLKIANTGRTAARKLRLALDRSFHQYGDKNRDLAEMKAFNEPIESLAPGGELIFALAQGFVIFGENADPQVTPSEFKVTASYEYEGARIEEMSHIDLKPYLNSTMEPSPLVDELERIRKAIEKLK